MAEIDTCKCLIGGQWAEARTDRFGEVWNPSTGQIIARTPLCGEEDVNRAVQG